MMARVAVRRCIEQLALYTEQRVYAMCCKKVYIPWEKYKLICTSP